MSKPNIPQLKGIERRTLKVEIRAVASDDSKAMRLEGYAARFNEDSELIWGMFVERIMPGAFDDALKTSDVRALFNHDPSLVLGRLAAGTLRLSVDETGLRSEIDLPDTQIGRDLWVSVQRGDISQMSFAFEVRDGDDDWQYIGPKLVRTINRVHELFDVSPVTYPAYESTSVSARAEARAGELMRSLSGAAGAAAAAQAIQDQADLDIRRRRLDLLISQ